MGEQNTKAYLRSKYHEKRNSLSYELRNDKSEIIFEKLIGSDLFKESEDILCYVDYRTEVMTKRFIEYALSHDKNIYCPVVIGLDIEFYNIRTLSELTEGYQKILEPQPNVDKLYNNTDKTAFIIVPGIAFDVFGNRMGYGKGFYDRYLSKHSNLIKLAIAFEEQIIKGKINSEKHDIKMDYIITDGKDYVINE